MRVRSLSLHASYRCGHSGACCSSGWEIAVEPEVERRIESGIASGVLRGWGGAALQDWGRPVPGSGDEPGKGLTRGLADRRVALSTRASGCVFFDAAGTRLCAVHHRLGEDALPTACRQFPRVVTLTPLGVSVTLSHYCPTAAALLFEPPRAHAVGPGTARPLHRPAADTVDRASADPIDPALRIVEGPPAFPPMWPFEGLDATAALPPLLRPGVLMSWPALERWEEHAVHVLARAELGPDAAVATLAAAAEAARRWTPAAGAFDPWFERRLEDAVTGTSQESSPDGDVGGWNEVAGCAWDARLVPAPPPVPDEPVRFDPALARVVRRWLATKAFASWAALQGEGLRTTVASVAAALRVLRAECARGGEPVPPLDRTRLEAAIRRADLLLLHLVDPEALARRLGRCEA